MELYMTIIIFSVVFGFGIGLYFILIRKEKYALIANGYRSKDKCKRYYLSKYQECMENGGQHECLYRLHPRIIQCDYTDF